MRADRRYLEPHDARDFRLHARDAGGGPDSTNTTMVFIFPSSPISGEVRAMAAVIAEDPHEPASTEAVVGIDRSRQFDSNIGALRPTGLELCDRRVEGIDANDLVVPTFLEKPDPGAACRLKELAPSRGIAFVPGSGVPPGQLIRCPDLLRSISARSSVEREIRTPKRAHPRLTDAPFGCNQRPSATGVIASRSGTVTSNPTDCIAQEVPHDPLDQLVRCSH